MWLRERPPLASPGTSFAELEDRGRDSTSNSPSILTLSTELEPNACGHKEGFKSDHNQSVTSKSKNSMHFVAVIKVGCSFLATMLVTPYRISCAFARSTSFARTSLQLRWTRQENLRSACAIERHRSTPNNRQNIGDAAFLRPARRVFTKAISNNDATSNPRSVDSSAVYEPPTTGLLSYLPRSWVPYAELIRLDKPTGTTYLFMPCLSSTLLAAPLASPMAMPSTVLSTTALFYTGALIMRGAGCTVNDLWDRNLDPKVERTRLRPIARGAVTVQQAIPFLGAQLLAGLGILLQFPMQCLYYGIPSLLLVGTYPLAKRVTNYPQFMLGLTFSWGAIMGFPALGVELLSNTPALVSAACLYGSCVAWTVVYDMIYAYQDIRDDAKVGIKSIARAQEKNAKAFLSAVATVQVALLAGAGIAVGAGPVFFVGTCGGAAATLGFMIRRVNLKNVEDCWQWFKKGAWFTGGAISLGLFGEYLAQWFDVYKSRRVDEVLEMVS